MKEHLGKFEADALAFAQEALEAAGIAFEVRADDNGARYAPQLGRMADVPPHFDVFVEADQLDAAKHAVAHWQQDAQEAALRESGAPPPSAEELAADAEWEKQKADDKAAAARPVWPGLAILAAVGGTLAYLLLR